MLPIKEYIKRPRTTAIVLLSHFGQWLPDKTYLKIMFRLKMGHKLNLRNPKTFSEKIQWLKLYNRRPEYTTMVDKYAVKEYVAQKIGSEYVIPTLGVWDKPEEIDWESLPNQFVLKTTHGGGSEGVVICTDKSCFDKHQAIGKLKVSMKQDVYRYSKEWPYKNVIRRIIAEQYIDPKPNVSELPDYKWYCFNGEPKFCQVIQDRSTKETIDFFDLDWRHQDFLGLNSDAGPAAERPSRPANLDTQIRIARGLSKDIPFSRIDLYKTGDSTYFGEVTFFPASGFGQFRPEQYNEILGQMLNLPGEKRGGVIISELFDNSLQISAPDLPDYKFFCFDGKVKALFVGTERQKKGTDVKFDFFDAEFKHLPFKQGHENAAMTPHCPKNFELMKQLASKLSEGIPQVRVDFYEVGDKVLFGELTFSHFSGTVAFEPKEWDCKFGEWIELPTKKHNK